MANLISPNQDALRFPIISYQPLRFLYGLGCKLWLLTRVPLWFIQLAIFPRPHEKWTLLTTFKAWMGREQSETFARIGITEELSLEPGEDNFQIIDPAPPRFYRGPLEHQSIQPEPIGITLYQPTKPDLTASPCVILHLHGGGFVWGSGRPKQLAFLANTLLEEAGATCIYAPQYRLSGYGEQNPFPAALQDALTSYLYLLNTLHIPPEHIVISGDSSGGNLAIALVRYIEALASSTEISIFIPRPLAAVLVSPWIAPGEALGRRADALARFKANPHWGTDHMPFEMCRWGARVYAAAAAVEDPYITALGNPFSTRVPMLVTLGEAEILEVQGSAWVREMCAVAGNRVEAYCEEAAPHDTLLLGGNAGWAESARGVARGIGEWVVKVRRESTLR